jgi:hypothetical protein
VIRNAGQALAVGLLGLVGAAMTSAVLHRTRRPRVA